tara:strand:- start:13086 stop:13310 length:225 start_codon:yes stop_codon:yes gene_type:complete
MKQIIEKNLAEFLKENNALEKFIANQPYLSSEPPLELDNIIGAFPWEDTPKEQGYSYWRGLDLKFNYLKIRLNK